MLSSIKLNSFMQMTFGTRSDRGVKMVELDDMSSPCVNIFQIFFENCNFSLSVQIIVNIFGLL